MDGNLEIREDVHRERMEVYREKKEELRRLTSRFFVAVLLDIGREVCKRAGGLGANATKTGHVAYSCASEFNLLAGLSFMLVIFKIAVAPVVVERMRKIRQACDVYLVIGSICLMISVTFCAYLRWFVVVE